MGDAGVGLRRHHWFAMVVAVSGVALIVFCATVVLVWQSRAARVEATRRMEATTALAQVYVEEQTSGLARLVAAYADRLTAIRALEPGRRGLAAGAEVTQTLDALSAARPDIAGTFVTDAQGKLLGRRSVSSTPFGTDFSYRDWYSGALRSSGAYVSEVYKATSAGEPFVIAASVVVRGPAVGGRPGPVVGVLGATYALSAFQKFVDGYRSDTGIRLVIVDQRGVLVAAGDATGPPSATDLPGRLAAGRRALTAADVISATGVEATTGWTVSSQLPASTASGSYAGNRGGVVAFAGFLIILVLAGTLTQGRLRRTRIAAEERLEQQRRRGQEDIDRFFSISLDLLCIAGVDGYFKQVNPAWSAVLGYSVEELVGRPFVAFVHPDDLDLTRRETAKLGTGDATAGFENRYRCKDGSYRWLLWRTAPDTEHGLLYAVARDITEQKRATQAAGWLAAIVDSSADAIVGANLDGTITSWNGGAERMFGYPADEMLGRSVLTLGPDSDRYDDVLLRSAPGETIAPYEARRLRSDGRLIEVSLSKSVVRDHNGDIVGISRIARDITEARRAAEALQSIIDTASDAYLRTEGDGIVAEWNHRAEALFGWTRAEAVGRDFAGLLFPGQPWAVTPMRPSGDVGTVAAEEHIRQVTAVRRDGTEVPVEITMWQVAQASGDEFSAFLRDVSERDEVEREMTASRDRALEESRLKSEFLAMMSHEIRTPMNAVIGLTGLLLRGDLKTTQRRYAESIRAASTSLLSMINDILDLRKIEAGGVALDDCPVSLSAVLEEVLELVAESAASKGLELVGYCDQSLPPVVRGDPVRIRQILLNLAANAVKFTAAGEVFIRIGFDDADARHDAAGPGVVAVRMEVVDTGIGIPPDQQGHVFDAFAQADSSTTRRFGGTGLGLSICRELAEAMGGRVGVHSAAGAGSTFWCMLPLSYHPVDAVQAATTDVTLKGLRILVADAHATTRKILTEQVRSWSMRATVVGSSDDALDALWDARTHHEPFDLLILGAGLAPAVNTGLSALAGLRPATPTPPIILVISRNDSEADRIRGSGVTTTLTRPVQQSALYDALMGAAGGLVPITDPLSVEQAAANTVTPTGAGQLLLVEDNPTNQMVALGILTELGYDVDVAGDGVQALERMELGSYRAVLMDCQMPNLDGYDATREIRRREDQVAATRIPIIAMTAAALKGDRDRCLAAGMDDYLSKPFEPDELAVVLQRWIGDAPTTAVGVIPAAAERAITERLSRLRDHVPPGTVERLLTAFINDGSACLTEIEAAVRSNDEEAISRVAHTFKGAAANVGALRVGVLCASLEEACRDHHLDTAPELLARLQGEFDATRALLQNVDAGR
jgi:PAS domain S-box-containing protein